MLTLAGTSYLASFLGTGEGGGVDTTPLRVFGPLIELELREKKRAYWSPREKPDGIQF